MKAPFYFLLFFVFFTFVSKGQTDKSASQKFSFKQLTFHSTECNGTCPYISMNIYKNKTFELSRTIYKSKGVADSTKSGNFKGTLDEKDYDTLLTLLKQVDWETVFFPKINCCDKPVKTIILTYNNKSKRYKSMIPPQSTLKLIEFLTKMGTQMKLLPRQETFDFEEVLD